MRLVTERDNKALPPQNKIKENKGKAIHGDSAIDCKGRERVKSPAKNKENNQSHQGASHLRKGNPPLHVG